MKGIQSDVEVIVEVGRFGQTVELVQTKPEVFSEVSKSMLVGLVILIVGEFVIDSPLDDGPATSLQVHVAVHHKHRSTLAWVHQVETRLSEVLVIELFAIFEWDTYTETKNNINS